VGSGGGKGGVSLRNGMWHAKWQTYAGCNKCRMTQRNKFYLEECVCKSIHYTLHKYAIPKVTPHDMPQTHSVSYPYPVGGSERTEW